MPQVSKYHNEGDAVVKAIVSKQNGKFERMENGERLAGQTVNKLGQKTSLSHIANAGMLRTEQSISLQNSGKRKFCHHDLISFDFGSENFAVG